MDYDPLQVKTSYSILESLNQIKELVLRAKELSYQSLAITDNNNMFGVMEFYQECSPAAWFSYQLRRTDYGLCGVCDLFYFS